MSVTRSREWHKNPTNGKHWEIIAYLNIIYLIIRKWTFRRFVIFKQISRELKYGFTENEHEFPFVRSRFDRQ